LKHNQNFDPQRIVDVIRRIPEGFIKFGPIADRLGIRKNDFARLAGIHVAEGEIGLHKQTVYDPARVTPDQIDRSQGLLAPVVPAKAELRLEMPTISERLAYRHPILNEIQPADGVRELMSKLEPAGFISETELDRNGPVRDALKRLLESKLLGVRKTFIYDPLRLGPASLDRLSDMHRRDVLERRRDEMSTWLASQPGGTVTHAAFIAHLGGISAGNGILTDKNFTIFESSCGRVRETWVRQKDDFSGVAQKFAQTQLSERVLTEWAICTSLCGETMRPDARQGKTDKMRVTALTYTTQAAAKRIGVPASVLSSSIKAGLVPHFVDPEGTDRIPAHFIENASVDNNILETFLAYTPLKVRQISLVSGLSYGAVRGRLIKMGASTTHPLWRDVRGLWNIPDTLSEFNRIASERYPSWLAGVLTEKGRFDLVSQSEPEILNEPVSSNTVPYLRVRDILRQEQAQLRSKLLEIFPTWDNDMRLQQQITLHIGPTNSGKTHDALNDLERAGSGWYLSPLRLLAYEVFETLNKRGVKCNLLTGEESIPVDGARITASTIEMFNPHQSGQCTVIDEAHMLSDSGRGWAWTRALIETRSPDIHVIGAPLVESLVMRLAGEIGIAIGKVTHERLTPLKVMDTPWSLDNLPPRTILVAFSRTIVLGLKSLLEKKYNRSVSVVYGSLPPEVRLNQAERFASGKNEICVATDAIGMGLNLPADNVCFFETEKFDGQSHRVLTPNEIRQIGGRAGRFGLSEYGWVGALSRNDLKTINNAVNKDIDDIVFAYVAPTPESIALMPGSLDQKLSKWVDLNGIPEKWKEMLKPVDLNEQIVLAKMLTARDLRRIGQDTALELINAPCVKNTENYWLQCAHAIIVEEPMPVVSVNLPKGIDSTNDLETFELAIRCADIYLWLSQRRQFSQSGPQADLVRSNRYLWSMAVDQALIKKVDTTRRCRSCGKPLDLKYRYNICGSCYNERRNEYEYY